MTILADKKAAAAAPKAPARSETLLARKRAGTPRGEYVEMPMLGRVWVELAGGAILDEIESAVYATMDALKLPLSAMNMRTYDHCRSALTLAWAVRDPENHAVRVGTEDEWRGIGEGGVDLDLMLACSFIYGDVRERLSPVGMGALTKDQLDGIRLAIEKKNPMSLLSAGVVALSLYLLTTDVPQPTSPTTQSSTGESQ